MEILAYEGKIKRSTDGDGYIEECLIFDGKRGREKGFLLSKGHQPISEVERYSRTRAKDSMGDLERIGEPRKTEKGDRFVRGKMRTVKRHPRK